MVVRYSDSVLMCAISVRYSWLAGHVMVEMGLLGGLFIVLAAVT